MGKLLSIWVIECIVNLYDIVTLPLYYLIQQPWKNRQLGTRIRAVQVKEFCWVNVDSELEYEQGRKLVSTLDELFRDSVATYANKHSLGVRKILAVEYKEQNGKTDGKKRQIKHYVLDDQYTWFSYREIEQKVIKLSAGLIDLCNDSIQNSDGSRKLLICADTCMEWFLMAHACFRNSITVVTTYTSLDDDTILSTLLETEVRIMVASHNMVHRLPKILAKSPLIDTVIILDEPLPGEHDALADLQPFVSSSSTIRRLITYRDLEKRGEEVKENITHVPTKDDIAILMYTSGSTGKAKGVMLPHHSIVYTALSFSGPGGINELDRYIGFLPLGHVLELAAECIFLRKGSTIAYSSPFTLTDHSPYVKKGQHGDATIFKPTIMGAVPLVLDRIKSAVQQAVKNQGPFYDQLINDFVIRYKRYWWERFYETPLMNRIVCGRLKKVLGGHIRAVCSGGAALSRDTQEYLRHVTDTVIIQGYGLTETSAAASFCDIYERRYNVVGAPYPSVQLKLESWSDYSVHDKPYPRGEIIIGGQPVSAGYYKMEELTKEHFFVDPETGVHFFRTGDIGLMLPDGVLKIIDRKKDIVKPLSGEYISLSAIESVLTSEPIVDSICVYCSQYSNYVVAIVRPNSKELRSLASQLFRESSSVGDEFRKSVKKQIAAESGANEQIDLMDGDSPKIDKFFEGYALGALCCNKWIIEKVLDTLQKSGAKSGLKKTQIPSKIKLASEEWNQESGLVTASFKLRRREIERFYQADIKQLYVELGQNIDQNN